VTTDERMLASGRELFDDLADEFCAEDPAVSRSTMMGFPCLRVAGAFAASFDHRSGDLVVKLPRDRVAAAVEAGEGQPFAPAGKVFREWLAITDRDPDRWRRRVTEAIVFVTPG
jgi:hypothetical protein